MWGVDWVLRHLRKKEQKSILDFKRVGGKLKDADDSYTSSLSEDFDRAVIHQLCEVPAEDKRIHEEDLKLNNGERNERVTQIPVRFSNHLH